MLQVGTAERRDPNTRDGKRVILVGLIWIVAAITTKSLASVLVRKAAIVSTGGGFTEMILNPYLVGAYFSLGLQSVFWVMALRNFTLILSYPLLQLSFVLNILAAHYIFGEMIAWNHALGIGLITIGAAVVSVTSRVN